MQPMLDTSHLPRVPEWKKAGDFEDILYEKSEEGIAKITINRPQVRNAFRPLTVREMETALADARDDENIGVIILTGQGKDAFCSGGDQKVRGNGGYVGGDGVPRLNVLDFQRQIRTCPKPVIAMVAGWCVGGGQTEHNLIREMLSINCVDYAIIETEYEMDEYMWLVGYSKLGEYDKYTLYGREKECYPMRIDYWGYVRRVYFYLLGRRGKYEEIYPEIQMIGAQEQTLDEVAYRILESDEFLDRNMTVDEAIEAIYRAIYYRDVTEEEKLYWEQYVANNGEYKDMYYLC